MKHNELTQLNYSKAITDFGHSRAEINRGDHVILVEAVARFLADSNEPVKPRRSVIVAEVTEVVDEGKIAEISKIHRFYEDGSHAPETGRDSVPTEHFSKSAMQRIEEGDDVYESL